MKDQSPTSADQTSKHFSHTEDAPEEKTYLGCFSEGLAQRSGNHSNVAMAYRVSSWGDYKWESSSPSSRSQSTSRRGSTTKCNADPASFKLEHLKKWEMPEELWNHIPENVRIAVSWMQESGAIANTVFERVESKLKKLGGKMDEWEEDQSENECLKVYSTTVDTPRTPTVQDHNINAKMNRIAKKLGSLEMNNKGDASRGSQLSNTMSVPTSRSFMQSTSSRRVDLEATAPQTTTKESLPSSDTVEERSTGKPGLPRATTFDQVRSEHPSASSESSPDINQKPSIKVRRADTMPPTSAFPLRPSFFSPTGIASPRASPVFHRPPRDPCVMHFRAEVSYLRAAMVDLRHGVRNVHVEWNQHWATEAATSSRPSSSSSSVAISASSNSVPGTPVFKSSEFAIEGDKARHIGGLTDEYSHGERYDVKKYFEDWSSKVSRMLDIMEERLKDFKDVTPVPGWGGS